MTNECIGLVETIETPNGLYEYLPQKLFYGRKLIDKRVSNENLKILSRVLRDRSVEFGLIYGTLLGAVRERDFIDWDEDVDVFLLEEKRDDFLSSLWELRRNGLELVRVEGDLYSLMRNEDYIDIYVFRAAPDGRVCNEDFVPSGYLENCQATTDFLGERYRVPNDIDSFLCYCYGKDWRTPKRGAPAKPWSTKKKIKEALKRYLPFLVAIKRRIGNV